MEIKYVKKKQNIRNLFEKLLAREKVKINQIKFLFKRYLEFEMEHGSENGKFEIKFSHNCGSLSFFISSLWSTSYKLNINAAFSNPFSLRCQQS